MSTKAWTVFALSEADIPDVTPLPFKSTDTVNAVSNGSVLFGTIFSRFRSEQSLSDIGTQIRPLPFFAIKFIFEESIVSAAVIKSPSFSLSSSSTTIIISPFLIDSIASSILSNFISVIFCFDFIKKFNCLIKEREPNHSIC